MLRAMRILVLAVLAVLVILPGRAAAEPGALTQSADPSACVSETGDGGRCVDGYGLAGAWALAISPDGRSVYAVSPATQTLAAFARDSATGRLTETFCLTLWVQGGDPRCQRIPGGLSEPHAITVSGDGRSVYVANLMNEVSVFRRDPQTGALTQPANQPCITSWSGCLSPGQALGAAADVVVSPDGGDVYVGSLSDAAVAELRRDPVSSVLSQPAGRKACISRDGSASSATGIKADCDLAYSAFKHPIALAITPDGAHVLAADNGSNELWDFPRSATGVLNAPSCAGCGTLAVHGVPAPADVAVAPDGAVYVASATPGDLAVLTRNASGSLVGASSAPGRYACVDNDGSDGCVQGRALAGAEAVAVAPDGRDVYVAASAAGAIDAFERDGLHQLDGRDGCLSYDGGGGICAKGELLEGVHSLVVSPDGRQVYAVSANHGAVLTFDREQPAPASLDVPPPAAVAPAGAPPAAAPAPASPAAAPPAITAFSASPRRFRAASGTRLRFTVSAPAAVRITLGRGAAC